VPATIKKEVNPAFIFKEPNRISDDRFKVAENVSSYQDLDALNKTIMRLEKEMQQAAKTLEFEKAAILRDQIKDLKKTIIFEQ
jgi:excinuclease ABC subunit B